MNHKTNASRSFISKFENASGPCCFSVGLLVKPVYICVPDLLLAFYHLSSRNVGIRRKALALIAVLVNQCNPVQDLQQISGICMLPTATNHRSRETVSALNLMCAHELSHCAGDFVKEAIMCSRIRPQSSKRTDTIFHADVLLILIRPWLTHIQLPMPDIPKMLNQMQQMQIRGHHDGSILEYLIWTSIQTQNTADYDVMEQCWETLINSEDFGTINSNVILQLSINLKLADWQHASCTCSLISRCCLHNGPLAVSQVLGFLKVDQTLRKGANTTDNLHRRQNAIIMNILEELASIDLSLIAITLPVVLLYATLEIPSNFEVVRPDSTFNSLRNILLSLWNQMAEKSEGTHREDIATLRTLIDLIHSPLEILWTDIRYVLNLVSCRYHSVGLIKPFSY